MAETIFLKPKTLAEKRAELSLPLRILTSPKTTIALAATLGTLLFPAAAGRLAAGAGRFVIKRPLTAVLTIPTAATVLLKSKRAREAAKLALDPRETVKRAEKIAEIIEKPKAAADILGIKDLPLKEKVIAGLKAAGLVGAAAAVAVGGVVALKKGKAILEARKTKALEPKQLEPGLRSMGFTEPQPVGLGGIPIKTVPGIPTGAPGAPISPPSIHNIIQIQLT